MEAALAVDFMTPALATWMEKQASPEEAEAKRLVALAHGCKRPASASCELLQRPQKDFESYSTE